MKQILRENPPVGPDGDSGEAVDEDWSRICPATPPCLPEGSVLGAKQMKGLTQLQNLRWRLPMPPKFMPYMEKHRIYDLFYELAVELVINRPKDHVQFLRHQLKNASLAKDRPRVIMFGPPFFELEPLGKRLASILGVPYVPILKRFFAVNPKQGCETTRRPGESLPRYVARVLRTEPLLSGGWVVGGFPRSPEEAELMRRHGVRPTHVLQMVPAATPFDTCLFSKSCKFTSKEIKKYLDYTRRIRGLREVFMPVLREVDIRQPSLDALVNVCVGKVRDGNERGPPCIYRVVLLGPPGSGVHTQAKKLAHRFGLILIDAGVEEVRSKLDECSERLLDAAGERIIPNDRIELVQNQVMKPECLFYGWVLIDCPQNINEMRALDRLDTPPNRVLVLDAPVGECRERLIMRRFNKYTGAVTHLDQEEVPYKDRPALRVQSADTPMLVDRKIAEYTGMLPSLLEYLGDSALVLRVSKLPSDRVFEMVSSAVLRRPPPFVPRDPEMPLPAAPPPTPTSQQTILTDDKVYTGEGDQPGFVDLHARPPASDSSSSGRHSRVRLSARLAARSPKKPAGRYSLMAARVGWPYDRSNTITSLYQRGDSGDRAFGSGPTKARSSSGTGRKPGGLSLMPHDSALHHPGSVDECLRSPGSADSDADPKDPEAKDLDNNTGVNRSRPARNKKPPRSSIDERPTTSFAQGPTFDQQPARARTKIDGAPNRSSTGMKSRPSSRTSFN